MKHGRQFVKSIIPGRKRGFRQARPHKHTYTLSLRDSVHTDEVAKDTGFRNAGWPSSKKVDSDFRIGDVGSKQEKPFVLVDMAESFVNTWLTSILLGLMPWTPAGKQDYQAPRDKIHREKERQEEWRWSDMSWEGEEATVKRWMPQRREN